jgi:hypothetical protein
MVVKGIYIKWVNPGTDVMGGGGIMKLQAAFKGPQLGPGHSPYWGSKEQSSQKLLDTINFIGLKYMSPK